MRRVAGETVFVELVASADESFSASCSLSKRSRCAWAKSGIGTGVGAMVLFCWMFI